MNKKDILALVLNSIVFSNFIISGTKIFFESLVKQETNRIILSALVVLGVASIFIYVVNLYIKKAVFKDENIHLK
ncbi:MAG: hypothetical protein KA313_10875 [Pseudarcicella sp.]|nr:hypothetical protein [Pseudarcicella sp.]MBP6411593.1 hypothetical protein [Pseudarcicella sp.]